MLRTFRADSSAVGEHANLTGDLACCRLVIGTRLHSRDDLDIATVLADESHAAIVSAIHRDLRGGRNGVGAQLTETGTAAVPAAFTVVAPTVGTVSAVSTVSTVSTVGAVGAVALSGGHGGEEEQ